MKRFLFASVCASVCLFSFTTLSQISYAQRAQNTVEQSQPNGDTRNQLDPYQPNAGSVNSAQTTQDIPSVDWRWFLPLLAIPIALLIWWAGRDEEEEVRYTYSPRLATIGAKGGKTQRKVHKETRQDKENKKKGHRSKDRT